MPYASVTGFEVQETEEVMKPLAERASVFPDSIDRARSLFILRCEVGRIDKAA